MKVKLLAHTPEPEKLVAAAAKNCYSFTDVDSVLDLSLIHIFFGHLSGAYAV